mgnify:CR=1 FL=1|jgi:hypothetical protein
MKKVIFISVLFALISMCGCKQETSKESEISKEQETPKELNTYQLMDIQFKILDVSSKDSLVEEADKLIPKECYDERVILDSDEKSVEYSLNTGYKLSVNEVFDEKSGIVPYTSLEAKFDIYDMEDTKTFIDGILDYLKEKKRLKKEGISEVVDKPDYKLIALIWDGGFSSIEMKQNGAIGFDIIFINYYDMNKQKKK